MVLKQASASMVRQPNRARCQGCVFTLTQKANKHTSFHPTNQPPRNLEDSGRVSGAPGSPWQSAASSCPNALGWMTGGWKSEIQRAQHRRKPEMIRFPCKYQQAMASHCFKVVKQWLKRLSMLVFALGIELLKCFFKWCEMGIRPSTVGDFS